SGLSVEVIYIPKDTRVLIKWGTPNRLRYRDEASNKVITVGARGEFDVSVTNAEQFFRKVVGAKKEFNLMEFRKRFSETVATEFADIFLKTIEEKHLTYDKFTANKKSIGDRMGEILSPMFENDWGLSVLNFKIADFDLQDEDMEAIEDAAAEKQKQEKLKEYLAELERLDDKQWEREKYLRQLELQDRNAYYEVLKVIGSHRKSEDKEEHKCPHCGLEYKPADKFCPHCGIRVSKEPIICPDCGKANESTAVFCANCGKKLSK
ncbi:MAG: SPFH domain-containing protein, partial [Clostridia bacterium]|nr:SPFH domain-containing protein [Clostridia bacterium]